MKVRERLPDLAEGVLGGRARAWVEGHVASCARCAAELADLRAVLSSLRAVSPERPPAHLVASVQQAVRQSAPSAREPAYRWARLAVSSAAAAVVVAAALAFHFTQGPGPVGKAGSKKGTKRYKQVAAVEKPALAPVPREIADAEPEAGENPVPNARPQSLEFLPPPRAAGEEKSRFGHTGGSSGERAQKKAPPVVSPVCEEESASRERMGPRPYRRYCGIRAQGTRQPSAGTALGGARGDSEGLAAPRPRADSSACFAAPSIASQVALPVTARIGIDRDQGRLNVVLTPQGAAVEDLSLVVERPKGQPQVLWQGRLTKAVTVELPGGLLGPGPGAVGLTIRTKEGSRHQALFFPVLSRIGETAASVPSARYQGETLGEVLSRLSALSGLVLFAETPLDRPVYGELAGGKPDVVLAGLAADAGMSVEPQGDVVRILVLGRGENTPAGASE